jgi:hypothetical protein
MYPAMPNASEYITHSYGRRNFSSEAIACDWRMLREQLLMQWRKISPRELEVAGPHRSRIAALIERKYGIASQLAENYLRNFERTMPVSGNA